MYEKNSMPKTQEVVILYTWHAATIIEVCCPLIISTYLKKLKTSERVVEMLIQEYCGEDWIGWVYLILENDRWYSL